MFIVFMLSRLRRVFPVLAVVFGSALLSGACSKVPLLAPSGSTITLIASATALPINGTTDVIAQVIEAGGTPPQDGTLVSFTTTLGLIQPSEAETKGGKVTVKFMAGTQNGTAVISAFSGGASVSSANTLKVAIGAAAVSRITLNASPSSISALGGTATLTSFVFDANGNVMGSVPVSFSTDAGTVAPSVVTTDGNGKAESNLATNRTAKVTATAGVSGTTGTGTGATSTAAQTATVTVNVNTGPAVSIATTTTTPVVGQPVVFTVTVAAPGTTGSAVRDVTVDFGDGQRGSAGTGTSSTVQHVYRSAGVYVVTAVATDANNDTGSAQTSVVVGNGPLPTVKLEISASPYHVSTPITFTLTGTIPSGAPTNTGIASLTIDFGDGSQPFNLGTAASGQSVAIQHTYQNPQGEKVVTARVVDTNGNTSATSTVIFIGP